MCWGMPASEVCTMPGFTRAAMCLAARVAASKFEVKRLSEVPREPPGDRGAAAAETAFGLAYHTMGGAEFHPALMVCWPTARVSPMGAEGAVNILHGKSSEVAPEESEKLVTISSARQAIPTGS